MFEQELKMEERASNAGPVLLIAAICLTIVGTAVYVMHEARKGMSEAEARNAVTSMLEQRGPATLHFRTGLVLASSAEKATDPQYELLKNAQVIETAKHENGVQVSLTENGEKLLSSVAGTRHMHNADGTEEYVVPLGTREVIAVTNVNVISPSAATIHYTWKWRPTAMGDIFDLSGSYANGLDVWQRAALAKQGADLFHGAPVSDEYSATSGWQVARN